MTNRVSSTDYVDTSCCESRGCVMMKISAGVTIVNLKRSKIENHQNAFYLSFIYFSFITGFSTS